MYSLEQIKSALREPARFLGELNDGVKHLNKKINHFICGDNYNVNGTDIFNEDWDNLIILDACRFDYFKQYCHFSGELETRSSRGSKTIEFIRGNFHDKELLDLVYVSANPWYPRLAPKINSQIYRFEMVEQDNSESTRKAGSVTERAIKMQREHPDKKLLIHYVQPHEPYLDESGDVLIEMPASDPYRVQLAGYDVSEIKRAYTSCLKYVLEEVEILLNELDGLTVISADHGELFNESMSPIPLNRYRHPEGIYVDKLISVPWFIHDTNERRKIKCAKEPYTETTTLDESTIDDQLEALGYKT